MVDVVALAKNLEDDLEEAETALASVRRRVSELLDELEAPAEPAPEENVIPGSEPLPLDYGESAE